MGSLLFLTGLSPNLQIMVAMLTIEIATSFVAHSTQINGMPAHQKSIAGLSITSDHRHCKAGMIHSGKTAMLNGDGYSIS